MVTMLDDRAVAKHEARLDVIDHLTAGSAETVGSDPARAAGMVVSRTLESNARLLPW